MNTIFLIRYEILSAITKEFIDNAVAELQQVLAEIEYQQLNKDLTDAVLASVIRNDLSDLYQIIHLALFDAGISSFKLNNQIISDYQQDIIFKAQELVKPIFDAIGENKTCTIQQITMLHKQSICKITLNTTEAVTSERFVTAIQECMEHGEHVPLVLRRLLDEYLATKRH